MPFPRALRALQKHPSPTLPADLSLAAGIALMAALASIAAAIVFSHSPVARPGEIVRVFNAIEVNRLGSFCTTKNRAWWRRDPKRPPRRGGYLSGSEGLLELKKSMGSLRLANKVRGCVVRAPGPLI